VDRVIVTYLEMKGRAQLRPARIPEGFAVHRVEPAEPSFNAAMYREVGAAYRWTDRAVWSEERWRAYAEREELETWAGRFERDLVGYFELAHGEDGVEIAYFGLLPAYVGRGLGGPLLTRAIECAWNAGASRVWVHTCTLDHPSALANYRARGMEPYRVEQG
jgi:GNAT superfamily N-acetyltransferase